MKFFIVALFSKILGFFGKMLGGGTDLPGKIALKLYPRILRRIRCCGTVIAVTGSNGKTTTSNLIAHILRENQYTVVNNTSGSNLTSGIVSVLLKAGSLSGVIKSDYVVLEVDECYARFVFEDLKIDYFLILNLLRDQVVRNGNPDLVFNKIISAIRKQPEMTLVLNANEPISQNLAGKNKSVYFAMDRTSRSTERCISGTNDCKVCPHCFHLLRYEYFHYNHLGKFCCSNCDYASHVPDFLGSQVDFEGKNLLINGFEINVPFDTTFNMFNVIAAAAMCCTAGLSLKHFAKGVGTFCGAKGRLEYFNFGGRPAMLLMTKQNAASLDQSLAYVLDQAGEKTVVLFVNNVLYLDYKDISWLYDVAFDRLCGRVKNVLCSGNRALDAAVCLKAAGINREILLYEPNLSEIGNTLKKTSGDLYILAASAFGHEGKIVEELKNEKNKITAFVCRCSGSLRRL